MSMITKCPACDTHFRVTPLQLQAQHGMVRCGRCAQVFDGFRTLAAQRVDAPPEAPPPLDVVPGEPGSVIEDTPRPTVDGDSPAAAILNEPPEPPRPEPPTVTPLQPVVTPEPAMAFADTPIENTPVPPVAFGETSFESLAAPRRRSVGLAFGIGLLLLALSAQGVYLYRGEIAARVPETRPYFNTLCAQLGCNVALPQRPRSISIEASDLQATDPANPGLIGLTATLRNQATMTLGYPALDVVLTNAKDHTVARRIFLPAEYLDAGKEVGSGIAPSAEVTVKLNIDSGDLGAVGFRLDLLAAPGR